MSVASWAIITTSHIVLVVVVFCSRRKKRIERQKVERKSTTIKVKKKRILEKGKIDLITEMTTHPLTNQQAAARYDRVVV